jgi:hypothetical protein
VRYKLIVELRLGRGEIGGPPGNAGPEGAVGAAEGEIKRRDKGRR